MKFTKKNIVYVYVIIISLFSFPTLAQIDNKCRTFSDYLSLLPDSCCSKATLQTVIKEARSGIHLNERKNNYDYDQPYPNITIRRNGEGISSYCDTANLYLIIYEQFRNISIKVYVKKTYAIIAFSEKMETEIEALPVKTCFYKVKRQSISDMSEDVLTSFDFCEDNYSLTTISYFDTTTYRFDCNNRNLNYYFTNTDTIFIVDCKYDISEEYEMDKYFWHDKINGSDIVGQYILKKNSFILIK